MTVDPRAPLHLVVMGVSGSGKSSVGRALANALQAEFIEGDDLHSSANVARMAAGVPLTDADRQPWLDAVAAAIAEGEARGMSTVTACSALRRAYRDRLRAAVPASRMRFVFLDVDEATLRGRMDGRDHFMPPDLLASQLATLEPLASDELGVTIDARTPIDAVVATALAALEGRVG